MALPGALKGPQEGVEFGCVAEQHLLEVELHRGVDRGAKNQARSDRFFGQAADVPKKVAQRAALKCRDGRERQVVALRRRWRRWSRTVKGLRHDQPPWPSELLSSSIN